MQEWQWMVKMKAETVANNENQNPKYLQDTQKLV